MSDTSGAGPEPLFRKVDSVQLRVPDLDSGLAVYRDKLGHDLIWRTENAVGLRMPEGDTEIVLKTERDEPEVDLLVKSANEAALRIVEAGGQGCGATVRHPDRPLHGGRGPLGQPISSAGHEQGIAGHRLIGQCSRDQQGQAK